jgi:hypothetical protein
MEPCNCSLIQSERCFKTVYYEKTQLRLTNSGQGIETSQHNVEILTTQPKRSFFGDRLFFGGGGKNNKKQTGSITFSSELSYHADVGLLADSPAFPGYIMDSTIPHCCFPRIWVIYPLLATSRLEHTYFLRYFGPLGRMTHFSLLILFLLQSRKRGKWNYTIHGKTVMPQHTYIHSLLCR